jgi:hypothetical protein
MRLFLVSVLGSMFLFPTLSFGEDPGELIDSAKGFLSEGKYNKAIEDLQWAMREIRQLQIAEMKQYLPESANGYETEEMDDDAAAAAMFNINFIEAGRRYVATSGDESVEVKIMSGDIGGSGLGAMMKMAQMFGTEQGELVRVKGYKCTVEWEEEANHGTLTAILENDMQVTVEIYDGQKDNLKQFAELVDFEGLEALWK